MVANQITVYSEMTRNNKTIGISKRLSSLSACLGALSLIQTSAVAADKPQYLPPIAPQVDSSATSGSGAPGTGESNPRPAPAPDRAAASSAPADAAADDRVNMLLRQALEKHSQGDSAGAERLFRQVLSISPENGDANYNLGAMAEDRHDWAGALRYYGAAAKANPSDHDIRDALASVKEQLRNSQASAQSVQDLQKKERFARLGQEAAAAYKAGNFDEAINDLQTIAREQPNDASTEFALGQAYRAKGDSLNARQHLSRAAALAPDNELFATALRGSGQTPESQDDGLPKPAPDFRNRRSAATDPSGWQDDNSPQAIQPPPQRGGDNSGLQPFTSEGESQLEGHVANGGGRGGMGTGTGLGLGLGAIGLGLGLFGLMRSQPVVQPSPYGMPYGYAAPYYAAPPPGYSPYGYGNPYRGYRMGRHSHW